MWKEKKKKEKKRKNEKKVKGMKSKKRRGKSPFIHHSNMWCINGGCFSLFHEKVSLVTSWFPNLYPTYLGVCVIVVLQNWKSRDTNNSQVSVIKFGNQDVTSTSHQNKGGKRENKSSSIMSVLCGIYMKGGCIIVREYWWTRIGCLIVVSQI